MLNEREKKLRQDFVECLGDEGVVDELIGILKEDYILVVKDRVSCRDCFNYNRVGGFPSDWCVLHQEYIRDVECCVNCSDYLEGGEVARVSMSRLGNCFGGGLFYE